MSSLSPSGTVAGAAGCAASTVVGSIPTTMTSARSRDKSLFFILSFPFVFVLYLNARMGRLSSGFRVWREDPASMGRRSAAKTKDRSVSA